MANNAVSTQLAIMVKKPTMVWPGLDRMDLHRKRVSGDGNCLFASLADQLYGDSTKHHDIRSTIVEYMRQERPEFEHVALKDDLQQKRATRRATSAIRNNTSGDLYEEYLTIMGTNGTYGGEIELVAFVQRFDQDVTVHLPCKPGYPETLPYTNEKRDVGTAIKPTLHLCYDNKPVHAHYDSTHKTSITNNKPKTVLKPDRQHHTEADSEPVLSSRDIRNRRNDVSKDLMHEFVTTKAAKEVKGSLEQLIGSDRARSPSIASSQQSTSSKRSFEDDGESQRARKRTDRGVGPRGRNIVEPSSLLAHSINLKTKLQSGLATPVSTQDGNCSSDQSSQSSDADAVSVRRRSKLEPDAPSRSATPESQQDFTQGPPKSLIILRRTSLRD